MDKVHEFYIKKFRIYLYEEDGQRYYAVYKGSDFIKNDLIDSDISWENAERYIREIFDEEESA